jgi:diguanylate cyclase (GGDEF)-like protein/PAS domain S-box-containing protein
MPGATIDPSLDRTALEVLEAVPDAVAVSGEGRIAWVNGHFERLFSTSRHKLVGERLEAVLLPRGRSKKSLLDQADKKGRPAGSRIAVLARRGDGVEFPADVVLTPAPWGDRGLTMVFVRDATERTSVEDELRRLTLHDALTGLPNQTVVLDLLGQKLARSRRTRARAAVVMIDLDRFTRLNDRLGNGVGDELLVAVAERLREVVGAGDTVARLGDDEFAIVTDQRRSATELTLFARRISSALRVPFPLKGNEVEITATIGIAVAERDDTPQVVLKNAETAMARAKKRGRGRIESFDVVLRAETTARLELARDLEQAIEGHQLRVDYQPIVHLDSWRIVGVEALVRWNHPRRGLLLPPDFIPIAEDTGLIVPIGTWVLNTALHQVRAWNATLRRDDPLSLMVNVSFRQITRPGVTHLVRAFVKATGPDRVPLVLDLGGDILAAEADAAVANLSGLRELGVRSAIDGFGRDAFSVGWLRAARVDLVKIDCSGEPNGLPVAAAIELARNLGVDIVAKNVEREETALDLRRLGCTLAQGRFVSPPREARDIEECLLRLAFKPGPRSEIVPDGTTGTTVSQKAG